MYRAVAILLTALLCFGAFGCTRGGSLGGDDDDADSDDDDATDDDDDAVAVCGNGEVEGSEVCDDGNTETEFPPYDATDCIDDCSLVLATCGDSELDDGEDCDDGNDVSNDDCNNSCGDNAFSNHSACERSTGSEAQDISSGDIVGCESAEIPESMVRACALSNSFPAGANDVYAAEGDCQVLALKCEGFACGFSDIGDGLGDYDADVTCPSGTVLIDVTLEGSTIIPTVSTKLCTKTCDSDRDCRWNTLDPYWEGRGDTAYGQYRCRTTPASGGATVCTDGRNAAAQ